MAVAIQRKRKRADLGDLNRGIEDKRPIQHHFYVGYHNYKLSISTNPVDYLIEYINTCLTDTAGFVRDEALELTNPACHPMILTHMVCSILSYNKVPVQKIHQCMVRGTLIMAEPAILVSRADQTIALYISETMLRSYVHSDSAVTLNFDCKFEQSDISSTTVDDILKQVPLAAPKEPKSCASSSAKLTKMNVVDMLLSDEAPEENDYEYGDSTSYKDRALKSKRSKVLYALFTIADHAATHFLENEPDHSEIRSYITHAKYGTKNVSTLHSAIQVIGTTGSDSDGWTDTTNAPSPVMFYNCLMDRPDSMMLNYEDGQILM